MAGANTPYTKLDSNQVLKQSFDEANDLLRVGIVGATLAPIDVGGMAVQIDHTEDSVRLGNGTYYYTSTTNSGKISLDVNVSNATLAVTQSGTWNINNVSGTVSLPTGAATYAAQTDKSQFTKITDGTNTATVNTTGQLRVGLYAENDAGTYRDLSVNQYGHLDVDIRSPRLPFGAIHVENMQPIFQIDGVYALNSQLTISNISGTGQVVVADSLITCSTGVTANSSATLQSRKRTKYRPGQGIVGRWTALYTTPVASSYQIAGLGHPEDGLYFGYKDLDFGILYVNRGVRETRTLTVSTASSTTESITITLNSVAFSVPVTNSGNANRTAYEISLFTYAGWTTECDGATVIFLSGSSASLAGTYTLSAATTAVGTFARTKAGVASTDLFIKQTEWNGDKLDGTGASGVTLIPTKLNVYQMKIQYLGAGALVFEVETTTVGESARWTQAHIIRLPNTLTTSSFGNPSFPFTMAAYSAGSTTNLSVKTASFAAFLEGQKFLHGSRFTYLRSLTTVGDTNLQALFSIHNSIYYSGRSNQSVVNIVSLTGAIKHTSPVIYYLIKNGTLAGNPAFAVNSTNSCTHYDQAATTVTYSTNDQVVWTGHLGDTGQFDHNFDITGREEFTIQPGETYTLAAKATTGTPAYVTGSLNTREDQ